MPQASLAEVDSSNSFMSHVYKLNRGACENLLSSLEAELAIETTARGLGW